MRALPESRQRVFVASLIFIPLYLASRRLLELSCILAVVMPMQTEEHS